MTANSGRPPLCSAGRRDGPRCPLSRRRPALVLMRALLAIALVLLLAAIGSIALVYFGSYNVAASDPHWNLTQQILDAVKTRSIKAHASGITVPADLEKPDLEGSFPSGGFRCFRCGLICRLAFFPRRLSNLALGDS